MSMIQEILKKNNLLEQFLHDYSDSPKPVILYGAGNSIMYFINILNKYNVPITAIVDKSQSFTSERYIEGIRIYPVEYLNNPTEEAYVIISALSHRKEIYEIIKKLSDKYLIHCFDPSLEIIQKVDHKTRKDFYINNESKFESVASLFADDFSVQSYSKVLEGAFTNDSDCYSEIGSDSQYFPDFIRKILTPSEIFVDLGAYIGDSILDFIKINNNEFKKAYAFEPKEENMLIAKRMITDPRVEFCLYGIGSKTETLYLHGSSGADDDAYLSADPENAIDKIDIVSIDDYINGPISFVKMDIEGMELDALKGAKESIIKYHPKLAISIYHKLDDFLTIPQYILSLDNTYKLYLRHYWNSCGTDTVLFAI